MFPSLTEAIRCLFNASSDGTINIRSYSPDSPRSREFVYGIASTEEAVGVARRLAGAGLFIIANETIDVADGGVSGVAQGGVVEYAPNDTPRCVEKPGVASLPNQMAISLLSKVYRFTPEIGDTHNARIEFSIHPKPRGWKGTHTLIWEYENTSAATPTPNLAWPNRFSRHIGDKAFGLLMAEEVGLPVPRTTVVGRRVAPFSFGVPTGSCEVWTRTAPRQPDPGRYTTTKGWVDPFKLLAREDPEGATIMAVLCQSAISAKHSGAAVMMADGDIVIEGRLGEGDKFMLGKALSEPLPVTVLEDVRNAYCILQDRFGPVRIESVHDGSQTWIVQLIKRKARLQSWSLETQTNGSRLERPKD